MTGDQSEAQDAVQEAFVRAWARRGKIDRNGAPEAWVRVTAWRIAASRWQRSRHGIRLESLTAQPESTAGPTPGRVAFSDALRKVPADQRRALVLYHLCDLTVEQIAAETGVRADDAARQARPPATADIIRQGDRRRRSRTRQSLGALSAAGVVGAGVALGLGLTGSAPAHATGTIRTAAFTLVANANGTATLTVNNNVLFDPGTLQRDLARDGIPAKVTAGSFCSSEPAPAAASRVVAVPKIQPGQAPAVTIDSAAMPAGTELSFGNFELANSGRTIIAPIDSSSYRCTSTIPSAPPPGSAEFGFSRGPS